MYVLGMVKIDLVAVLGVSAPSPCVLCAGRVVFPHLSLITH